MKLYRCDLCGRVFDKKIPHICKEKNYRKHHLFFTEIDDVDNEYIKKSEADVRENFSTKIWQAPHILSELPISNIEYFVNWEQIRAYAAIAVMQASAASPASMKVVTSSTMVTVERLAQVCVRYADTLVKELKKEKQ